MAKSKDLYGFYKDDDSGFMGDYTKKRRKKRKKTRSNSVNRRRNTEIKILQEARKHI